MRGQHGARHLQESQSQPRTASRVLGHNPVAVRESNETREKTQRRLEESRTKHPSRLEETEESGGQTDMDFDEEGRESETPVAQAEDLSDWGNAGFRRKRACLSALLRDRTLFSRET